MDQRIALGIPELGLSASVRMLADRAPLACAAIWEALETPVERRLVHTAITDPVAFLYSFPALRWLGPGDDVHELFFAYGAANLRLPTEEGWRGSVWGRIDTGLDEFAAACHRMRMDGTKRIKLSRET